MKATELMIGDWVFEAGRNAKVIRLNEEDCFVRPIPLTPEILEKNGWKWDKYWEIWKHKSIPHWEFALDERFNWAIKKECYTDGGGLLHTCRLSTNSSTHSVSVDWMNWLTIFEYRRKRI